MPRTQNRASLLHFEGQRCKAGYRWLVEDGPERDFGLVPVSDQTMSFEPASTLFLEFSRVAPQKTAIQEFANANGLLGLPAPGLFEGGRRFDGERLSAWLMQINRMHLAVELWRHVQKGDRRGLEHHIEWKSDRIVYRGDACLGEE